MTHTTRKDAADIDTEYQRLSALYDSARGKHLTIEPLSDKECQIVAFQIPAMMALLDQLMEENAKLRYNGCLGTKITPLPIIPYNPEDY